MRFIPEFSVIIVTYNRAYILWQAIESVLGQTYPFFELLVIDDGSADDTEKLVKVFTDPRIRYLKLKKNIGPSAARNQGLKIAKGKYIAYLDSDNTWHRDFLETMAKTWSKHPDKILIFCKKNYRLTIINDQGKKTAVRDENTYSRRYFDLKRLWQRRIIIDTNSMSHKKKEIVKIGGWDKQIKFWEDWELVLRVSQQYPKGFLYINRALLNYEQILDLSNPKKAFALWEREERKIFNKYRGYPLLAGQTWFPPRTGNKSTLGVIEYLKNKYNS